MADFVVGTMSGTSMDGVDVALLKTDGESLGERGPCSFRPYTKTERSLLRQAMDASQGPRAAGDNTIATAEKIVTDAHIEAIETLLEEAGLRASEIDLVGFHGQTLFHDPKRKITIQIGDASALAAALQIRVAYDFRGQDVAAGGEGAPLVPIFHQAMLKKAEVSAAAAVINIGGVANITVVKGKDLLAFDTGPGSALIDDWIKSRTSKSYDQWGRIAAQGEPDLEIIEDWLRHPYFAKSPPKSLDRHSFSMESIDRASLANGAATLTKFTATTISRAVKEYGVEAVYVCGGGANNQTMMKMITDEVGIAPILTDEIGFDVAYVEAQAFAYLAKRVERSLPITFPGTTGVSQPMTGGKIAEIPSG